MAGQDDGEPELDGGSKFLGCQRGMLTIKIEGREAERKAEKERNARGRQEPDGCIASERGVAVAFVAAR